MTQDQAANLHPAAAGGDILTPHQPLHTSGARTALPVRLGEALYLIVPQLAEDIPGQPAHMNGGDSDVDALIFRWDQGRFVEHERLPLSGGEDVMVFETGNETFLATAGVRTGSGPYDLNTSSNIYRWENGAWARFQAIPCFAAKQWSHFTFDGRHFLALAQGVTVPTADPRHPRELRIFEWRNGRLEEFQVLEGCWGYNWAYFEIGGQRFLGYADHTSPSLIYRWDDARFVAHQTLIEHGGRAFMAFEHEGQTWLAFAVIDGDTVLYRWDGKAFAAHQTLGGQGGREFELIRADSGLYLVRICFIQGAPTAPKTDLLSQIYRWEDGRFVVAQEFPTFGGTDAAAFTVDGQRYLAVSNSLTADVRFRQDSMIYRLDL